MRISILAFVALLPFLAACNTTTDVAVVDATQAQLVPTMKTFQEMKFTPVAYPSTQFGPIGSGDPVFDFGYDGKSYYKAIELPHSATDYILEVTTDTTHPGAGSYFRLFFPSFIFLDGAKQPTSLSVYQGPFYENGEEAFLRGTTRYLIQANSKARYVVIYTTRSVQMNGQEVSYGAPGVAYAAGLFIPIAGQRAPLKGAPEGRIGITTKAFEPAAEE